MRENGLPSLVRLGANESTFGPSPRAIEAMASELPRLCWYGDPESYALREALAAHHAVAVENVCVGAGIDDLMGLVVRAFTSPGSIALTTRGTYPTFAYHIVGYGARLETVSYTRDGTVDADALIARARDVQPAIVYICNPDNPSGTALPPEEIARLFAALPKQTLFLLDEAYADFVPGGADALGLDPRVIRLRTFSKAYGMAGARIGYALLTPRNGLTLEKIRLQYGVNRCAQIGALAALADRAYHRHVIGEVAKGRDEYYVLAESLGRRYLRSHTNFVCIDFETPQNAADVMAALLKRGVFIRKPGAPPLDGYIRVSVGTPSERAAFAVALRAVDAEFAA